MPLTQRGRRQSVLAAQGHTPRPSCLVSIHFCPVRGATGKRLVVSIEVQPGVVICGDHNDNQIYRVRIFSPFREDAFADVVGHSPRRGRQTPGSALDLDPNWTLWEFEGAIHSKDIRVLCCGCDRDAGLEADCFQVSHTVPSLAASRIQRLMGKERLRQNLTLFSRRTLDSESLTMGWIIAQRRYESDKHSSDVQLRVLGYVSVPCGEGNLRRSTQRGPIHRASAV